MKWHKIAEHLSEINFGENNLAEISVDGKNLCVAKTENGLHICSAKCPHAGGVMSNGYIDAMGNIVCPIHRYKFNLANGRNISGEGYYLKTFAIEYRADGIYVWF